MALAVSGAFPLSNDYRNESLTYLASDDEYVELERQISVDPISLRESSAREDILIPVVMALDVADQHLPPPLPPSQFKFLSYSLPNSANSSPRFGAGTGSMKKKANNERQESRLKVCSSVKQQDHNQLNALQDESPFQRSKSCGEGRASAPVDDLDLWLNKPNLVENKNCGGFSRTESSKDCRKNVKKFIEPSDDEFKCGALCLFLPGFSKGKAVRSIRKEESEIENVISRTVSMEKFECGSWASSAVVNDAGDDGDSMNLFFDLPMELIRSSVDTNTPVSAAFVFDKDRKGITKNSSTKSTRKSNESSHQVRFSAPTPPEPSSPTACITPRLRKAREEFNAFLEAQSTA